jgi:hypothetical protein
MLTRSALKAFTCLILAFASFEARSGVELVSFGIDPSPPSTHVFNSIGPIEPPGEEAGPGATTAWPVTINLALLSTLPATMQINFPDRDLVNLTRLDSERNGNALFWMGEGADCSGMFRVAADGGFKGTVSCINAPYGINHPAGSSDVRLTRYDNAGTITWEEDLAGALPPQQPENVIPPTSPQGGTDTKVDILVLYNTSLVGVNIWQNATDQIQAIQTAMSLSTTAGHPTIAQVRLAGAAWIVHAVNPLSVQELQFLQGSPQVAALRNYYAADVVLYLTSGSCVPPPGGVVVQGIGYVPGS